MITPDPQLLSFGDALVPLGAFSVLVALVVLLVRSGEGVRKLWIMRAFALMLVAQLAVLALNTASIYWGLEFPFRDWVRIVIYASIPISQIFIASIIVKLTDRDHIRKRAMREGGLDPEVDDTQPMR
jgi:hypothetical protein